MSSDLEISNPVISVDSRTPELMQDGRLLIKPGVYVNVKIGGMSTEDLKDPVKFEKAKALVKEIFTHIGKELYERMGEKNFENLRVRKIENAFVAEAAVAKTAVEGGMKKVDREYQKLNISPEGQAGIEEAFIEIGKFSQRKAHREQLQSGKEEAKQLREVFYEELGGVGSDPDHAKKKLIGKRVNDFLDIIQRPDKPVVPDRVIFMHGAELNRDYAQEYQSQLLEGIITNPKDRARLNYTAGKSMENSNLGIELVRDAQTYLSLKIKLEIRLKEYDVIAKKKVLQGGPDKKLDDKIKTIKDKLLEDIKTLWLLNEFQRENGERLEKLLQDPKVKDDANLKKINAVRKEEAQGFLKMLEKVSNAIDLADEKSAKAAVTMSIRTPRKLTPEEEADAKKYKREEEKLGKPAASASLPPKAPLSPPPPPQPSPTSESPSWG